MIVLCVRTPAPGGVILRRCMLIGEDYEILGALIASLPQKHMNQVTLKFKVTFRTNAVIKYVTWELGKR